MENADLKTLFAKCEENPNLLTIEATVDTGFEFMAVDECKSKFGEDVEVVKGRGRIIFNIAKSQFSTVMEMRSIDNVYLVIGCIPKLTLTKHKDEDLNTIKAQCHLPNWEHWLPIWCDIMKFDGIVKPTPEQYEAASLRVRHEKEIEKAKQAERQARHKERQARQAKFRADKEERRLAARLKRDALIAGGDACPQSSDSQDPNIKQTDEEDSEKDDSGSQEAASVKTEEEGEIAGKKEPNEEENAGKEETNAEVDDEQTAELDNAEVESLEDDDEKDESGNKGTDDIPANERVLRFRATCYRTGRHEFTSMQAACEFGGELQQKFNWVVDLTKYHADVVLSLDNDEGHLALALTRESLHRRNIKFFGPTTLRATVCHNLLRLAELQPGDVVVDPLAGGGSICIEGAVAFKNVFNLGGEIYYAGVNRMYSNFKALRSEGQSIAADMARWDARRLPLREASVDVVVSDMPFGLRMSSKSNNRTLYKQVLREMARVVRPKVGRAVLLTLDRKNFSLALAGSMGLWWQARVISANIGGLDAAVFNLKRTEKLRPTEEDLEADKNWRNEPREEFGSWNRGNRGNRGRGGYNRGGRRGGSGRGGYHRR